MLDSGEAGGAVIRGGSQRALAYVAGILLGLVSAPLAVRYLGEVRYGRLATVTAILFVVGALTEVGLTALGVREYAIRAGAERRRFMQNLIGMRAALTVAGVGLAVALTAAAGYGAEMTAGVAIGGLGLLIATVQLSCQVPLATGLRLGWIAVIDVARQVATVLALVVLVLAGATLMPFFAVPIVAGAAALALTLPLVRGTVSLRPAFARREWAALLVATLPYAAATALGAVYYRVGLIGTSLVTTETETGAYAVAFRLIEVAAGVPWLVVGAAFPILVRAARDDPSRLRYALQRLADTGLVVGGAMAVVTVAGADLAVRLVAGAPPEGAIGALRILGASLPFTFLVATWGYALLTLTLYRWLVIVNGSALLLAVGLTLTLVPPLGPEGAALGTLAVEALLAVAYAVVIRRRRADLRAALRFTPRTAGAVALGLLLAATTLPVPGVPEIVRVAVALALFAAPVLLLRAVPEEVAVALRRRGAPPAGTDP